MLSHITHLQLPLWPLNTAYGNITPHNFFSCHFFPFKSQTIKIKKKRKPRKDMMSFFSSEEKKKWCGKGKYGETEQQGKHQDEETSLKNEAEGERDKKQQVTETDKEGAACIHYCWATRFVSVNRC